MMYSYPMTDAEKAKAAQEDTARGWGPRNENDQADYVKQEKAIESTGQPPNPSTVSEPTTSYGQGSHGTDDFVVGDNGAGTHGTDDYITSDEKPQTSNFGTCEGSWDGDSPTSSNTVSTESKGKFKVTLSCQGKEVVFEASIPIQESRTAGYETFSIVHLPTDIWAYRGTGARRFIISGNLISRNPKEAAQNAKYVDWIRSWVLPDFGDTGATPPILRLSGYGNNNIRNVPVILNNYSITYPDNVDYIFQGEIPMPVILTISLDLSEAYSPKETTEKKWKINISKGGSFVYGVGATVAAGGVGKGDSIANIGADGKFPGVASMKLPETASAGNLLGGLSGVNTSLGTSGLGIGDWGKLSNYGSIGTGETPNNATTLGATDSPSVTDSTPVAKPGEEIPGVTRRFTKEELEYPKDPGDDDYKF
jgi:hypothetical protein